MLKKITPELVTDLDLNEDQRSRLRDYVLGNVMVDHQGRYLDAEGEAHDLARIHLIRDAEFGSAVPGASSDLEYIDGEKLPGEVFLILEDQNGKLTGASQARHETGSAWHYGVLFREDGKIWFAGRDKAAQIKQPNDEIGPDEPVLIEVSSMASERPGDEPFSLDRIVGHTGQLGEFWITDGDTANVVSIPWWADFAVNADGDTMTKDKEVLDALKERVRGLDQVMTP